MQREHFSKAFTLVELLCAVGLMGVLSFGLIMLVSRTLEAQIGVQETFTLQQEAARGFAWLARDIESAWFPLSGEAWADVGIRDDAGAFQTLSFSRWGEAGVEAAVYHVANGRLWRTISFGNEGDAQRITQVCDSVTALRIEPRDRGVAVTLVLGQEKRGQRSFTRVLTPFAEI